MLTSKWVIILSAILAIFVLLYFLGRKSVHSEIMIAASPTAVWVVLMDTQKYREWNPVLIPIQGKLKEGEKVRDEFIQSADKKSEIPSTVKKMIPNQLLNQGGGMKGVITCDHRYILEAIDGQTKVTIHEDYAGIYVNFWNPKPVAAAYERLNQALKRRVESMTN
ncbi:MAG: SRPBCC domain-containing protein [Bacteroidota bacterium]